MQMDLQMANARLYEEMQTPTRDRSPSPARVREKKVTLVPQAGLLDCWSHVNAHRLYTCAAHAQSAIYRREIVLTKLHVPRVSSSTRT